MEMLLAFSEWPCEPRGRRLAFGRATAERRRLPGTGGRQEGHAWPERLTSKGSVVSWACPRGTTRAASARLSGSGFMGSVWPCAVGLGRPAVLTASIAGARDGVTSEAGNSPAGKTWEKSAFAHVCVCQRCSKDTAVRLPGHVWVSLNQMVNSKSSTFPEFQPLVLWMKALIG